MRALVNDVQVSDTISRSPTAATLVNSRQSAGTHTYTLRADALFLSSGVCFYCLQAGGLCREAKNGADKVRKVPTLFIVKS